MNFIVDSTSVGFPWRSKEDLTKSLNRCLNSSNWQNCINNFRNVSSFNDKFSMWKLAVNLPVMGFNWSEK